MGIRGNRQADDSTADESEHDGVDESGSEYDGVDAEYDDTDDDDPADQYDDTDDDDPADQYDDSEDDPAPEPPPGSSEPPRGKQKRMERVRTSVQSANIDPAASDFSTKWAIDRLDEREKRFSFAAAGGAILFATILYLAESSNPNFTPSKNQLHPITLLIVGMVTGALLVGTTILGRRAPVGFVALFTGAAFSESFLFLGLPFIALALWLLYRSYKIQRETAANLRANATGNGTASPPGRSGARPASSPAPSKSARSKGPAKPTGNKRYTPPAPRRPAPPPPKPSRKERKAALKADS